MLDSQVVNRFCCSRDVTSNNSGERGLKAKGSAWKVRLRAIDWSHNRVHLYGKSCSQSLFFIGMWTGRGKRSSNWSCVERVPWAYSDHKLIMCTYSIVSGQSLCSLHSPLPMIPPSFLNHKFHYYFQNAKYCIHMFAYPWSLSMLNEQHLAKK